MIEADEVVRKYINELMRWLEDLAQWLQALGSGRSPLLAGGSKAKRCSPYRARRVDDSASCSRYARSCETRLVVGSVNNWVNRCDVA